MQLKIRLRMKNYNIILTRKQQNFNFIIQFQLLLTDEEIFPHDQSRATEEAKFTYSPSGKAFEK